MHNKNANDVDQKPTRKGWDVQRRQKIVGSVNASATSGRCVQLIPLKESCEKRTNRSKTRMTELRGPQTGSESDLRRPLMTNRENRKGKNTTPTYLEVRKRTVQLTTRPASKIRNTSHCRYARQTSQDHRWNNTKSGSTITHSEYIRRVI